MKSLYKQRSYHPPCSALRLSARSRNESTARQGLARCPASIRVATLAANMSIGLEKIGR